MWKFNKYDKVQFELVENDNQAKKKKYSYIWDFNTVDQSITDILKNGKNVSDNEIIWKNKKTILKLKLISVKKIDGTTRELIEENLDLKRKINDFEETLKKSEIKNLSLKEEIENLDTRLLIETNKFKEEVIEIQKKAQSAINEHKQKSIEHQEVQIKEAKMYALQSFLEDLIQPLNNFEKAILSAEKIDNDVLKNFIIGFNMLYKQVENVLIDFGLQKIIPKSGEKFDPNIHQVYEIVASDLEKDTILEVKNIGYKLHDRTIKPALVIVSK